MQQALFAGPEEEAAAASGKRKSKSADPGAQSSCVLSCMLLSMTRVLGEWLFLLCTCFASCQQCQYQPLLLDTSW